MSQIEKYQGIIPAFYACYDDAGAISPARVRALTEYFIQKGVKGLYVGAPPASASTRAWPSGRRPWRTSWPRRTAG